MKNWPFHKLLKACGMNVTKLAAEIGGGRAHVTQVLRGVPGRGHYTRRKLYAALTPSEISALGWPAKRSTRNNVPIQKLQPNPTS